MLMMSGDYVIADVVVLEKYSTMEESDLGKGTVRCVSEFFPDVRQPYFVDYKCINTCLSNVPLILNCNIPLQLDRQDKIHDHRKSYVQVHVVFQSALVLNLLFPFCVRKKRKDLF